jgi:hypothetical protein
MKPSCFLQFQHISFFCHIINWHLAIVCKATFALMIILSLFYQCSNAGIVMNRCAVEYSNLGTSVKV